MAQLPDKFIYNVKQKSFYEFTPFGVNIVDHYELIEFYKQLSKEFSTFDFFDKLIIQMTEKRIIEPSYYILIYDKINDYLGEYSKYAIPIYNIASNVIEKSNKITTENTVNAKIKINNIMNKYNELNISRQNDNFSKFEIDKRKLEIVYGGKKIEQHIK